MEPSLVFLYKLANTSPRRKEALVNFLLQLLQQYNRMSWATSLTDDAKSFVYCHMAKHFKSTRAISSGG